MSQDQSKKTKGKVSKNCMACICEVEGCEKQIGRCRDDEDSLSCGPYQIKELYWEDCGKPENKISSIDKRRWFINDTPVTENDLQSWMKCTTQMACSETCIQAFMHHYGTHCSRKEYPTCEDYARIHNGGPSLWKTSKTDEYWKKVKECCSRKPGGC